jgi:outer membrane protein assembly factor BamB
MRRASRLLGWLLLVACVACRREAPAPGGTAGGAPGGAADERAEQERVDRLRALPYLDFAPKAAGADERDGVILLDSARAAPGYSLYALRALCRAELVDLRGRVVNSWAAEGCGRWAQAELLPDGTLLVVARLGKSGRVLQRFAWTGEELWTRRLHTHHDAERTPDGRLLVLTKKQRSLELEGREIPVIGDRLILTDDAGEPLEHLDLLDVLPSGPAGGIIEPVHLRQRGASDILHSNSVEWMPFPALVGSSRVHGANRVLVSIRHQNLMVVIDWPTRKLVWSWGRGELDGPHDATWLANGNLLVFDNGLARGWSRVVEVDPKTDQIVWEYRADPKESFYTSALGGTHRLPNGNTMIANSHSGEAFEVTAGGETVWRFLTPYKNEKRQRAAIVRMKRYPPELVEPLLAAHRRR